MTLAIRNLHVAPMPPTVLPFRSRYGSKIVAAFLDIGTEQFNNSNLYFALMLPIKFLLSPTYGLGGGVVDVVRRISRWPLWQPPWILELNDFSNSESSCLPPSFGLIWLTIPEQLLFEDFQDIHYGGHLRYRKETILAILNLYVALKPLIKFQVNPTYSLEGDVVWRISRWLLSWILEWNDFSNSESPCLPKATHQVSAYSDFGADVI